MSMPDDISEIPDPWAGHHIGDTVITPDGKAVIKEFSVGEYSGLPMARVDMTRTWFPKTNRWFYVNELKGRR